MTNQDRGTSKWSEVPETLCNSEFQILFWLRMKIEK